MNTFVIILLIGFVCWMAYQIVKEKDAGKRAFGIAVYTLIVSLISICLWCVYMPQASDVYEGKTELRITNKTVNGIITESDTTIVFKELLE